MKFIAIYNMMLSAVMMVLLVIAGPAQAQNIQNQQAVNYFADLPDIPIMPNMVEIEQEGFSFDTTEGRVVQAYSFIPGMGIEHVLAYYRQALPGLGWAFNGRDGFTRAGEVLTIQPTASGTGDGTYVTFLLKTAG